MPAIRANVRCNRSISVCLGTTSGKTNTRIGKTERSEGSEGVCRAYAQYAAVVPHGERWGIGDGICKAALGARESGP